LFKLPREHLTTATRAHEIRSGLVEGCIVVELKALKRLDHPDRYVKKTF
jgi:hypothetical protein